MPPLLQRFPFVSLPLTQLLFRLSLAAVFFGHALMRVLTPGYFAQAGEQMAARGLPWASVWLMAATAVALVGSPLLVMNQGLRWIGPAFLLITLGRMAFMEQGWWVAEHGDGGREFSFVLCAMCLWVSAIGLKAQSGRLAALLSPNRANCVLRWALALFFMIHAASRFTEADYFRGLGAGLEQLGLPFGFYFGVAATALELTGGTALLLNRGARWAALGLFGISAVGIGVIHLRLGWFVGEFGNGGAEFSLALCAVCLLVAAWDRETASAAALPERHHRLVAQGAQQ
ncbi:DoxX family protein [Inhella sp.]|uniref:DoxX family protein n=1 Tax=Inhella sp. TaxID=1921806 RepID=UPI0035B4AEDE